MLGGLVLYSTTVPLYNQLWFKRPPQGLQSSWTPPRTPQTSGGMWEFGRSSRGPVSLHLQYARSA